MEYFSGYKELTAASSYDHLMHKNFIGSVRDPHIVATTSGIDMIPASIVYLKTSEGARKSELLDGNYKKVLYEYSHAKDYKGDSLVDELLVVDEDADAAVLAVPMVDSTRIYSAQEAIEAFTLRDTSEADIVRKFVEEFPDIRFGVFGSHALNLQDSNSDIDIFLEGCRKFAKFQQELKNPDVQQFFGLESLTEEEMQYNAQRFAQKYKVTLDQARRLSDLRCRYRVNSNTGQKNLSFSAIADKSEFRNMGILGTEKISKISEHGTVVDADYSTGFPRVYTVEINGALIDVVSMQWSFRSLAYPNEKVNIVGTLRKGSQGTFISLEENKDILLMEE